MKYVIIGNGAAAIGAIEGIRNNDAKGEIVLVSKENCLSYSKPQLYKILNQINLDNISYRNEDFYTKNNVSIILGKSIKLVDFKNKVVTTQDDKIKYDKLLIATGAKANIPKIKGYEGEIYSFTNIDEALRLKDSLQNKDKIAVLGGGLIGVKLSEYLHKMGKEVFLIVSSKGVLTSLGDEKISEILNKEIQEKGIKLMLSTKLLEAKKQGTNIELKLDSDSIVCDAIVSCKGVKPEISPFEKTDLSINTGIKVDDHMRTNIEDVYAAGDVTEIYNSLEDRYCNIPILPNAFNGGYCAGINMAGGDHKIDTVYPMNSLQIFDVQMITMGLLKPSENDEVLSLFDENKKIYRKLVIRNGILLGAALLGEIDRAGILNNIIRKNIDVSSIKDELLNNKINFYVLPRTIREFIVKSYTEGIK
ncbi:MAG: NAD(P)/FAD-dependent oxidoreductase [Candidatus Methanofastidiosa archaeon]|jgi:NAD(P)H-nitrite reductase large subunit|nr:NAD(P)/FAD-dependent oxidoreductase [Candidatus Methanofastidiosa archaeon]